MIFLSLTTHSSTGREEVEEEEEEGVLEVISAARDLVGEEMGLGVAVVRRRPRLEAEMMRSGRNNLSLCLRTTFRKPNSIANKKNSTVL